MNASATHCICQSEICGFVWLIQRQTSHFLFFLSFPYVQWVLKLYWDFNTNPNCPKIATFHKSLAELCSCWRWMEISGEANAPRNQHKNYTEPSTAIWFLRISILTYPDPGTLLLKESSVDSTLVFGTLDSCRPLKQIVNPTRAGR